MEHNKTNTTKLLLSILKYELKVSSQKWEDHWKKVVASQGEDFEGDIVAVDQNPFLAAGEGRLLFGQISCNYY